MKNVVTISMKPTHLKPSSANKPKTVVKPVTKPKKTTSKPIRQAKQTQPARSNAVQKFDIRLLTYHPVQDDAGIVIKLFYDGVFFQQVIVMKSIYEVWSHANLDQRRQFIANQLNPQLFGNNVRIAYNVCNTIMGYVDAVVARHIAQELAKQQAQRRRF